MKYQRKIAVRIGERTFLFLFIVSLLTFSACTKSGSGPDGSISNSSVIQPGGNPGGGVPGPGPKEGTGEGFSGRKISSALFSGAPTIVRVDSSYNLTGGGIIAPTGKVLSDYRVVVLGISKTELELIQNMPLGSEKSMSDLGSPLAQIPISDAGNFTASVSIPSAEALFMYLAEKENPTTLAVPSDLPLGFATPAIVSDITNPNFPSIPKEAIQNPNDQPEVFTPVSMMTDIYMTPLGTHNDTIAHTAPGPGYREMGGFTDLGSWDANGNQVFWGKNAIINSTSDSTQVIYGFAMTQLGLHIGGGPALPLGFTFIGYIKDTVGLDWGGERKIGVQTAPFNSLPYGTRVITDFYITPPGLRLDTTGCTTNFELVGYTWDCAFGSCFGYQSFCASYVTK